MNVKTPINPLLQHAAQTLSSHGGRMTAQRRLILAVLAESQDHPTAEELYQRVQPKNPVLNQSPIKDPTITISAAAPATASSNSMRRYWIRSSRPSAASRGVRLNLPRWCFTACAPTARVSNSLPTSSKNEFLEAVYLILDTLKV